MSGGKIRYGVFGARRGSFFMKDFILALGFELVAICDKDEALLRRCGAAFPKAATFTDFHAFIREEMDVVVLCNYFDEHAPYAIDALKAGKHVISETIPAVNMAELIALVETVKNSGLIYLLAEDYPFTAFSQRMASIYRSGEIGEVLFADGQYNNAISAEELALCQDPSHWKNNLAPTYYLTHALAPLVQITGQLPDQVSAVPLTAGREAILGGTLCKGDPGFAMTVVTRDKALFRIMGINVPGHAIWYSLHGTRGAMETERTTGAHYPENYWGSGRVRVWHDAHNKGGYPLQRFEVPEFTSLADLAAKSDQGGGELFVMEDFRQAFLGGKEPEMRIEVAASLAAAGILGWRSCLEGGRLIAIPDFGRPESYEAYREDRCSPFAADARWRLPASADAAQRL